MATGGSSFYKGTDMIHDFSCSKCEENDFNTEAQHFCPECEHYLCDKCVGLHNGYHTKHTVYGRGDVDKWVGSSIDRCDQHGKELEVHCDDHQELCCSVCVALNHRLCNSISDLPDLAKDFQNTEFKQLSVTVENMRSRLEELQKARKKDKAELKDLYAKIVAEMRVCRKEINSILDQIEKATIEQLDNMIGDLVNDAKYDVEKCVKMNDQLKNLMENFNQLNEKHKETTSFIGYTKCTAKLTQADNLIGEIYRKPKKEVQFVYDETIESFLKSQKTFGLFERKRSKAHTDYMYKVVRTTKYNVRIQQVEQVCTITGICELPSGQIVISDCDNRKVKLLNSTYQVIDQCELSASPNDVCHIAASEVAVAVRDVTITHEVQFITVTRGRLQKVRKFTTDHLCSSIAHHQGRLFVGSNTALYQYTLAGELVKKIHEDESEYKTVCRCAISPDGERIFVLNYDKNKLISLDKGGQELTDLEVQGPSGLCVSLSGQVFMCSIAHNIVIQVDSTGTKKHAIVAREAFGIYGPLSMGFIESTSSLVVDGGDNDYIYVFQLEKI